MLLIGMGSILGLGTVSMHPCRAVLLMGWLPRAPTAAMLAMPVAASLPAAADPAVDPLGATTDINPRLPSVSVTDMQCCFAMN